MGNLPLALNELVGRDREIAYLEGLFESSRLLTLTGFGGVGKTRLALELAQRMQPKMGDGAWWISLAPIREESAVVHAVAAGVEAAPLPAQDVLAAVLDAFAGRGAVIVFDNCEHHISECRRIVQHILDACPNVSVIATSQSPLNVASEQLVAINPLSSGTGASSAHAPAVALFVSLAKSASNAFELTEANFDAVVKICRALDGLPLAIELAASRVRSMTPEQIVSRLSNRLRLLDSGQMLQSDRHRSMRETLEWSYGLLSPDLQRVFDQLAVFAGDFDLNAARNVLIGVDSSSGSVESVLGHLVDQSMLSVVKRLAFGDRYNLAETFREFGHSHLAFSGALGEAQRRCAQHWLNLTHDARGGIKGADEATWRHVVDTEVNHLRESHAYFVRTGDVDSALAMSINLYEYAFFGLRSEFHDWVSNALKMSAAPASAHWPEATAVAALLAWSRGQWDEASVYMDTLDAIYDPQVSSGRYLVEFSRGLIAAFRGRMEHQAEQYQRCLAIALEAGDEFRTALITGQLAFALNFVSNADATEVAERAVALAEPRGNGSALSTALWSLGTTLISSDPTKALKLFERSESVARLAGSALNANSAASSAITVRVPTSSPAHELEVLRDQWTHWRKSGDNPVHWHVFRRLIFALLRAEDFVSVAVALGAEQSAKLRLPRAVGEERRAAAALEKLTEVLGASDAADLLDYGAQLDATELDAYMAQAVEKTLVTLHARELALPDGRFSR